MSFSGAGSGTQLKGSDMPKGTKVHRCVQHVKAKGGNVNPYAVCQKSTGQSYATGKPLRGKPKSRGG